MAFFQQPPALGNQFSEDRILQSYLQRHVPEHVLAEIRPSLEHMGELSAGHLRRLATHCRRDEPQHIPYDPWGQRVDAVHVPESWREFARVASREGLISLAYERAHGALSRLHQFAMVYLFDASTQMYTCPLAMTDGAARTLEVLGPETLRERALPRLTSRDPDAAWTSGQWMTERPGGSDVGRSETVARQENGEWRLYGTKWFTSAVTSDMALTLARPQGNSEGSKGLALFYVELRDSNGALRNIRVNRLKEKLGTWQLPTAELTLDGTPAVPMAGLEHGVRNMANMLNITRTWNAVGSVAKMRRGIALARDYARKRVAFGAPLADKPLHLETLADMSAEHEAAFQLAFAAVRLLGQEEVGELDESGRALLRLVQPVAKAVTAKQSIAVASESLEAFGGAGYVEDTGLPELLRDAQVLSIWEGTTNVLALEALRAVSKKPQALGSYAQMVQRAADSATDPRLGEAANIARQAAEAAVQWAQAHRDAPAALEAGARRFVLTVGRSLALALLVEQAQWSLDTLGDGRSCEAAQRFAHRGINHLQTHSAPEAVRALALEEA